MDKFGIESPRDLSRMNENLKNLGLPPARDPRELFEAEIIVVPGVPQIDPLPDRLQESYPNTTFVYSGPLLLPASPVSDSLQEWLIRRRREGLPILLVTLGTVWGTRIYKTLADCLEQTDFAIVFMVPQEDERRALEKRNGPKFQVTGFTDLRELVNYADVVLHHCGHATLYTVLLAGKPSLTLPTGEYDREDNALRLEGLACGRHLGHDFFRKGLNSESISAALKSVALDSDIKEGVKAMSRIVNEFQKRGTDDFMRVIEQRMK